MYVGSRRSRVAERPSDRVADAIGTATKNHKESNEYNHRHGKGLCKLKKKLSAARLISMAKFKHMYNKLI